MTDPYIAASQAFMYLGALGVLAIIAVLVWFGSHPDAEPNVEPAQQAAPAPRDECMVLDCHDEATGSIHGWATCNAHKPAPREVAS